MEIDDEFGIRPEDEVVSRCSLPDALDYMRNLLWTMYMLLESV